MEDQSPTSGNAPQPTGAAAALGIDLDPKGPKEPDGSKPGSRSRGLLITGIVVGAVFLLWVLVFAGAGKKGLSNTAPEGKQAPGFALDTIYGKHVDFADLKGKPVFVNFWASWCGPCKDEGPVLADAYRRWKGSGIVFIGVDESDSAPWARAFEEFYGIGYDSAFDPSGLQYQRWGLSGYPETFLVNPQGEIIGKKIGAFYTSGEIDSYLSQLAPNFTPKPAAKLVIPSGEPPVPQGSPVATSPGAVSPGSTP